MYLAPAGGISGWVSSTGWRTKDPDTQEESVWLCVLTSAPLVGMRIHIGSDKFSSDSRLMGYEPANHGHSGLGISDLVRRTSTPNFRHTQLRKVPTYPTIS